MKKNNYNDKKDAKINAPVIIQKIKMSNVPDFQKKKL